MSLIGKNALHATFVSFAALLALVASLLNGAQLRAQSYLQSGDAATSQYFGIDSAGTRMLKRSDTKDYDVEVWHLTEKKLLASITGLSGVVNDANISPDGSKVVTAERTGIVGVWDAGTGKQIRLLHGRADQIHDVRKAT
jgi:WD40 repeat protein